MNVEPQVFILGFKYTRKERFKCQLVNFILGQAKLAIYSSRKSKVTQNTQHDVTVIFQRLVKTRVFVNFNFYKSLNDLEKFQLVWCYGGAMCTGLNDELLFAPEFR